MRVVKLYTYMYTDGGGVCSNWCADVCASVVKNYGRPRQNFDSNTLYKYPLVLPTRNKVLLEICMLPAPKPTHNSDKQTDKQQKN